ncbi:hypothetical protein GCM10009780_61310 [Actinomadura alba]
MRLTAGFREAPVRIRITSTTPSPPTAIASPSGAKASTRAPGPQRGLEGGYRSSAAPRYINRGIVGWKAIAVTLS